jgi:hypothetical protein
MSDGKEWVSHISTLNVDGCGIELRCGRLSTHAFQCCSPVQGDVIGLVALDLILGIVVARTVHVSFVVHILRVHIHNLPTHVTGLGIPGHVLPDLEFIRHGSISERSYNLALGLVSERGRR